MVRFRSPLSLHQFHVCVFLYGTWARANGCTSMLHGEGRISPATPMNKNNDLPSRGQPQEVVQT